MYLDSFQRNQLGYVLHSYYAKKWYKSKRRSDRMARYVYYFLLMGSGVWLSKLFSFMVNEEKIPNWFLCLLPIGIIVLWRGEKWFKNILRQHIPDEAEFQAEVNALAESLPNLEADERLLFNALLGALTEGNVVEAYGYLHLMDNGSPLHFWPHLEKIRYVLSRS